MDFWVTLTHTSCIKVVEDEAKPQLWPTKAAAGTETAEEPPEEHERVSAATSNYGGELVAVSNCLISWKSCGCITPM